MKKYFILIIILVISCISCVKAEIKREFSANKIYEDNVSSVLYVETQDTTGGGIILDEEGTFATCFHIIANADYIKVKTHEGREYKVTGYKYINPNDDIAILTIRSNKKFIPIKYKKENNIKVGDNVYTISNPQGLQFVFSSGMINQITKELIQFSAPSSSGSSGGALLDNEGYLIGMITAQYNPSNTQNINFASKTSYFLPYINKKKKVNSKNLIWTDFIAENSTEKELKTFIAYAIAEDNTNMLFKYLKHYINPIDVPSDDYALYGTMALSCYMENYGENINLIDEAIKWYALAINSNKNPEIALYGIINASMIKRDLELTDEYMKHLKKYPKSYKHLNKSFKQVDMCKHDDLKCIEKVRNNIFNYLTELTQNTYFKDGK